MRPRLRPEDVQIWARVAVSVRPLHGRPPSPALPPLVTTSAMKPSSPTTVRRSPPLPPQPPKGIHPIEPNRLRRLDLGREPVAATLDLHGLGESAAHDQLVAFIRRERARGARSVLVITGKGHRGEGILRRRAPLWLTEPPLSSEITGLAEAHRTRGGAGALYVILKRSR